MAVTRKPLCSGGISYCMFDKMLPLDPLLLSDRLACFPGMLEMAMFFAEYESQSKSGKGTGRSSNV